MILDFLSAHSMESAGVAQRKKDKTIFLKQSSPCNPSYISKLRFEAGKIICTLIIQIELIQTGVSAPLLKKKKKSGPSQF